MNQGKIVAIITGVISILIAIAYLVIVQLIDFRGEMIPAPIETVNSQQLTVNRSAILLMLDQSRKAHFPKVNG